MLKQFFRGIIQKLLANTQPEVNCVEVIFVDDVVHHSRMSRVDHASVSNHIHDFDCHCIRFTIINLYFWNNATESITRPGPMVSVHLIEVCIDVDYFCNSGTGYHGRRFSYRQTNKWTRKRKYRRLKWSYFFESKVSFLPIQEFHCWSEL